MKQLDRRIVIVGAFLFIVGLAYGIMRFLIAQKEEPFMRPPVEAKRYVKTEQVKYQTIVSPVEAPGRVKSIAEIDIISEASGKIQVPEVILKTGSKFQKGDILFTIYPDEAKLALKAKKSQFLNSLANLMPDISIDYPEYEDKFRNFFNSIDIEKDLPEFPEFKNEKLKIYLASRNVLSEYYGILKDELQLKRHTKRAPFNGTYSEVYMEEGAFANIGARVARAIRTDVLELEVPLERFDAAWVKVGDPVTVQSDSRNVSWLGKVVRKSQFVDPQTQSQNIFVQLKNNKKESILNGEYLSATFQGHPIKSVMEIPRNVVFNSDEVFIVKDESLQKKKINIIKLNEKSLIFNGLEEGSILVVQPLINVQEGTLVEIQQDEEEKKVEQSEPQNKKGA